MADGQDGQDGQRPFYQIPEGPRRLARRMSLAAGAGAGLVFALTVCRCGYPGESAGAVALFSGADVADAFSHPLLRLLGGFLARAPLPFAVAPRFNLLAAALGALTVGMLFHMMWQLVMTLMRSGTARAAAPRIAVGSAAFTAAALVFSAPFWTASTRFTPRIADAAGLVFALFLLFRYACEARFVWLALFAFAYGAGMWESSVFLIAAPVVFLIAARVEWANADGELRPRFRWCLPLGAAGYLSGLVLSVCQARAFLEVPFSRGVFSGAVYGVLRGQYHELLRAFPSMGGLLIVGGGLGLLAVAYFLAARMLPFRGERSTIALLAAGSAAAGYVLFNGPGTAWARFAPYGRIPVMMPLLACLAAGLFFACWLALPRMIPEGLQDGDAEEPWDDERRVVLFGRRLGLFCGPALAACLAFALFRNAALFSFRDGEFADYAADRVLDALGGREWVVGNGVFDANLLVRAKDRGRRIVLLPPYRAGQKNLRIAIRRALEPVLPEHVWLRASVLLEHHFLLFLEELFQTYPGICGKAVCLSLPDLWYGGKHRPVVEPFCFGGADGGVRAGPPAGRLKAVWREFAGMAGLGLGRPRPALSKAYMEAVLRQLSLQINNFGTELDDRGDAEGAFEMYELARRFNPENVSALLNLIDLSGNRGVRPGRAKGFLRELRDVLADRTMRYPLWALSRYHGYVRNYQLFRSQGLAWVCSSCPEPVLETLRRAQGRRLGPAGQRQVNASLAALHAVQGDYEGSIKRYKELLAENPGNVEALSGVAQALFREGKFGEAADFLESGRGAGVPKKFLRPEWAVVYLCSGETDKARMMLDDPAVLERNPSLLGLLGMIMLMQGEEAQVENVILPKMAKLLHGTNRYFLHLLRGRLCRMKGKKFARDARFNYLSAMAIRPDLEMLGEIVLSLDMELDDAAAAELHAIHLLRRNPGHPYANYVMGTFRLNRGKLQDAERYFSRGVRDGGFFEAYNNYAETLLRLGKLDLAEKMAGLALEKKPGSCDAWALLSDVRLRRGKAASAREAWEKACSLNREIAHYSLMGARIARAEGDAQGFADAMGKIDPEMMSPIERKEYDRLAE